MPPSTRSAPPRPPRREGSGLGRKAVGVAVGLGAIGLIAAIVRVPIGAGPGRGDGPILSAAQKGTLRIVVSERGNLESTVTVDGICELYGNQNKIIQLVPEGSKVEKGQVVCRFDSSEIDKSIAQQEIKSSQAISKIETTKQEVEIQRNKSESEVIDATVEYKLAELDLEKYKKGDYIAEIEDINGSIALATKELEKSKDQHEQVKGLLKKGFKSPNDLRVAESTQNQYEFSLKRDQQKLMVKKDYEYKRKTVELIAKVDSSQKKVERALATKLAQLAKANSEYDAAKSTSAIEDQQLKEYRSQKDKAVIKAEQSGIVAYANEAYYRSDMQVREGATVFPRQKIFSLPDMTRMQVKVNIHESMVNKIKPGLKAEIRIDAFPNLVIVGTVKSVAQLADSNRNWMSGGVKEYPTMVVIDAMPKEDLRPAMTAEVKILVGELADVLLVPIQAIVERKGKYYAFVEGPKGLARREVKPGETNEKFVRIVEGLTEGERVALDARARAAEEFKAEDNANAPASRPTTPAPSAPPQP